MQIAEDYSHCEFLIRLPGYCPSILMSYFTLWMSESFSAFILCEYFLTCLMNSVVPAFRDATDVPLVVRTLHRTREEV